MSNTDWFINGLRQHSLVFLRSYQDCRNLILKQVLSVYFLLMKISNALVISFLIYILIMIYVFMSSHLRMEESVRLILLDKPPFIETPILAAIYTKN